MRLLFILKTGRLLRAAAVLAPVLVPVMAAALWPPVPARAEQPPDIAAVEKNLEQEREKKESLQAELRGSGRELEKIRKELISLSDRIRANEKNLSALEDRTAALAEEDRTLSAQLESDYASLSGLVLVLERLRRVPPETLIVRPGATLQAARAAMLLHTPLSAVAGRAENLTKALERLAAVRKELEAGRAEALSLSEDLGKKRGEAEKLVRERERHYGALRSGIGESESRIKELAAQAGSIRELMKKIEAADAQAASAGAPPPGRAASGFFSSGKGRLPVEGVVVTAFGENDGIGAKSQGLTIEARPGAIVAAPLGGRIKYAGTFKNYGKIVIIEHAKGYHSLIAGLEKIDTSTGRDIRAGEPVGILPVVSSRGARPALYYELRYKGAPVNPASKFADIRS